MEAYRDQYAKLFNSGRNVVVIAVSVDPDTALASWARDLQTPVLFGSDVGQVVGRRYGSIRGTVDNRNLFVIAPAELTSDLLVLDRAPDAVLNDPTAAPARGRALLIDLYDAAVAGAAPGPITTHALSDLDARPEQRLSLYAFGKAAHPMASAAVAALQRT